MYCPKCGTKCEDSYRFCYRCGFALPSLGEDLESAPVLTPTQEPAPTDSFPEATASMDAQAEVPDTNAEQPEFPVYTLNEPAAIPAPTVPPVTPGAPFPVYYAHPAAPQPPAPPQKKGALWPAFLILGIMMVMGLALYFLIPRAPTSDPQPTNQSQTDCFRVEDGVLYFDSDSYTGDSELVIPEVIDGQTITAIGENCFSGCRDLTTVILPDTITEIRDYAFSGCLSIRGLHIPEGVTTIGKGAFSNCTALEALSLPESLQSISKDAMVRCRKLIHIFYSGRCSDWQKLYAGTLPADAYIYCKDGSFPYNAE